MKTSRILNTMAFLSAMLLSGAGFSQEATGSTDARMNAMAESVYAGNMKNVAEGPALSLATISGARSASLALAEQNAVSNQQINQGIMSKMLAQHTTVGATEGASAINKVNTSDLPALLAQLVALASAGKQQETIVVQPSAP